MARRPDPLNLYIAHRSGLFQRLIGGGRMSEQVAELRISAFEAHCRELHRIAARRISGGPLGTGSRSNGASRQGWPGAQARGSFPSQQRPSDPLDSEQQAEQDQAGEDDQDGRIAGRVCRWHRRDNVRLRGKLGDRGR
jgi:hypothetical protein